MPLVLLLSFLASIYLTPKIAVAVRKWWRRGCDRCRVEDMGTVWSHTPHTCFPWRNPYKDRKGNVKEFGKIVSGPDLR